MVRWPEWWNYEIVLSPHVVERMEDRQFTEVDLRELLEDASAFRPAVIPGRFVVETTRGGGTWEVVVEPDEVEKSLIIVTAYEVE
jgi:hypothetical protein